MAAVIAYFCRGEGARFRPRCEVLYPGGLPLLRVALPERYPARGVERTARRLYRQGVRRFLTSDPALEAAPLVPVSPLPLCRAKAGALALALLEGWPPRQRRVALRGEGAGAEAWRIAQELCPRVGALYLDFDRGEEALQRRLRERFGAAPLHLGQGPEPQVWVELDPRPAGGGKTLRLWGEPDLQGLALLPEEPLPPGLPALPFLELLWETGRVELDRVRVVRGEEWP